MATGDFPTLLACSYASTSYNPLQGLAGEVKQMFPPLMNEIDFKRQKQQLESLAKGIQPKEPPKMPNRRVVQVFIADTDENVPLDKALLYKGDPKFTDLTDQELFFEIDIKEILSAYNAERVKLLNKKVKERTEYLEPVKIRDLKMTVVTIAQF